MITIEQIQAESINPALDEDQQLALQMLIKQYAEYNKNLINYPNLAGTIDKEQLQPTVKTKGLKAVLKALSRIPKLKVESQGTDKQQSFFSTKENWDALAQDALNVLYEKPLVAGGVTFFVAQPNIWLNTPHPANKPFFIF